MHSVTSFLRSRSGILTALFVAIGVAVLGWNFGIQPTLRASESAPGQPVLEEQGSLEALGATADDAALEAQEPPEMPDAPAATAPDSATISAYITGAVRAPDVYTLPAQARVKDLVMAAGGLADDADAEQINLAEHLKDGQHVSVPRQGEQAVVGPPDGTHVATDEPELININTASAAELEVLKGIGKALSQRIVEYRTANGPFASAEDLLNVSGIGSKLFNDIAPQITVGPT